MHWLYYDQQSPVALERAEAVYDSTIGYRETVGYRAGTTQAYKPLQVDRLLELPMHVMDTALFYPDYLGLSPREAGPLLGRMVDSAAQFGGCLTINWHDRSLAPERLWYACYRDLVQDLKNRCPWFATAGQAVSWFRKRRSVVFETDLRRPGKCLPGLWLRIGMIFQAYDCESIGRANREARVPRKATSTWLSMTVLTTGFSAELEHEARRYSP